MNQRTTIPQQATTTGTGRLPAAVALAHTFAAAALADPAPITPDSVRTAVRDLTLTAAHTYAHQNDDDRPARIRAFDIAHAAEQGTEDAAIVLDGENQASDPHCEPRGEVSDRYNVRLGRSIRDLDGLFAACVADANERGIPAARAVGELTGMLATFTTDAARDALRNRQAGE
ncbi:hypothetical protein LIX60_14935 [Streptomyces sp. S07_1.15]|uniref:hypothetical protein n=1 Tax=Streptomyces sp. S07_1.15 TaxID=2873925 RepID=UPI001D135D88|nr:hypothetical protein [Streptomyces sp. S07_1.15]MCC3652734.1 hypothetical protein [Streptomyces sp. S07_1.15]